MSINSPIEILDLPDGRIYTHTFFHSYSMFSHRDTLTKLDKVGHVVAKLTERVTQLEDANGTINREPTEGTGNTGGTPVNPPVATEGGSEKDAGEEALAAPAKTKRTVKKETE